ncbi:hypothetical protein CEXT_248691 [Caerostris extrusa]|uniref:Uncharacterized protein n=1 Tax=Caerostris extrusa TaxID=172846 RepID=A0AAV4TFZ7_CAEEX|nr:hypothetical protein CEXT_248691 [Caerostris extrusa]
MVIGVITTDEGRIHWRQKGRKASVTDNVSLQQQIAQLKERLRHAKMLSQERLRDITSLRQSFDHVLQTSNIQSRANNVDKTQVYTWVEELCGSSNNT